MRMKRPEPIVATKKPEPQVQRTGITPQRNFLPLSLRPPEYFEAAASDAVEAAYTAIKALLDKGDFKAAAAALQALGKKVAPGVVAKILGSAPKFSAIKITVEQLTDIIQGTAGKLSQAALDAIKSAKPLSKGKWNKPGNQRADAYIGTEVHKRIADAYEDANPGDRIFKNNSPISSILKDFRLPTEVLSKLSSKELKVKPDILTSLKGSFTKSSPKPSFQMRLSNATPILDSLGLLVSRLRRVQAPLLVRTVSCKHLVATPFITRPCLE
jgi:hypothetical protein